VYVTDRTNHNQDLFFMRRISNYRKLLGVGETAELKELKTVYRNLMKDWHPDKFQDTPEARLEAEEKSKKIIEAYHFLVSIAPETRAGTLAAYTTTTTEAGIIDFEYKSELLSISFSDGSVYEYYGVPKAIYVKLINAETPARFARRHIYHVYIYRSTTRQVAVV
jgi:curved DNA-binding protein CbpA